MFQIYVINQIAKEFPFYTFVLKDIFSQFFLLHVSSEKRVSEIENCEWEQVAVGK